MPWGSRESPILRGENGQGRGKEEHRRGKGCKQSSGRERAAVGDGEKGRRGKVCSASLFGKTGGWREKMETGRGAGEMETQAQVARWGVAFDPKGLGGMTLAVSPFPFPLFSPHPPARRLRELHAATPSRARCNLTPVPRRSPLLFPSFLRFSLALSLSRALSTVAALLLLRPLVASVCVETHECTQLRGPRDSRERNGRADVNASSERKTGEAVLYAAWQSLAHLASPCAFSKLFRRGRFTAAFREQKALFLSLSLFPLVRGVRGPAPTTCKGKGQTRERRGRRKGCEKDERVSKRTTTRNDEGRRRKDD